MKTVYALLLILLTFEVAGQNTTIEYLDINNVKAGILNRGDMFWNPDIQGPQYEFPKGSGKHSNFAAALWVSGIDQGNNIHISAQTYRQKGNDFWPGPLDNNGNIDTATSNKWDKIWKVNRTTIDSFIATTPHTLANTPLVILQWPAKGNPNAGGKNGAPLIINKAMAPFIDVNNDNTYNALDGDYPDIEGEQALWWVFNDNGQTHNETDGAPLKIEIQAMAFACNSISGLKNAIYINFKVRNLSGNDYHNTRFSFWDDIDLGYGVDDYIGVDTIRRMGICYNQDSLDETPIGYGNNLTQSGCILLKTPDDTVGFGGFVFNNNDASPAGNPLVDTQYYNYMNSKWKDGKPFTDACNARDTGNIIKYVYPSEPNDPLGWSEKQCAMVGADRRFLINSSSFTMLKNIEYEYRIAYVNTPVGSSNLNFTALKSAADTVIQYANGCGTSFPLNTQAVETTNEISLYPNPTSSEMEIKCNDALWQKISRVDIYSTDGKMIRQYSKNELHNQKINVQFLAEGLYFLKIVGGEKTIIEKFLKN